MAEANDWEAGFATSPQHQRGHAAFVHTKISRVLEAACSNVESMSEKSGSKTGDESDASLPAAAKPSSSEPDYGEGDGNRKAALAELKQLISFYDERRAMCLLAKTWHQWRSLLQLAPCAQRGKASAGSKGKGAGKGKSKGKTKED